MFNFSCAKYSRVKNFADANDILPKVFTIDLTNLLDTIFTKNDTSKYACGE